MVSLADNLVAGQGSELETHVFLVRSSTTEHPHIFLHYIMMKINHAIKNTNEKTNKQDGAIPAKH